MALDPGAEPPRINICWVPRGGEGVLNHLSNLRKMPFLLASCSLPGKRFSSGWNTSSSKNACVGGYAPRPYTGTFSAIFLTLNQQLGQKGALKILYFWSIPAPIISAEFFLNQFETPGIRPRIAPVTYSGSNSPDGLRLGSSCSRHGRHNSCLCSFKLQRDDTTANSHGLLFREYHNNNMALLPCVEEIEQKFGQLEGITFRGFFIGEHYVEQT